MAYLTAAGVLSLPLSPLYAGQRLVYQRDSVEESGTLQLEVESAVGSRDVRPFGQRGVENGVRVRYQLSSSLSMEAWGGALVTDDIRGAASLRMGWALVNDSARGIEIMTSAGFRRDFQEVYVPDLGLSAGFAYGRFTVKGSGVLELPLSDARDRADLLVGVGGTYQLLPSTALGIEFVGEDLEGFWDEEEAEGGARFVAGPTLLYAPLQSVSIRANVGASLQATSSRASGAMGGEVEEEGASSSEVGALGVLGRAAVVISF